MYILRIYEESKTYIYIIDELADICDRWSEITDEPRYHITHYTTAKYSKSPAANGAGDLA